MAARRPALVDSPAADAVQAPGQRVARQRAHNRQVALLEAAAHVFRRNGYAITTMRDIAAASGMTPGAIYYHYPSKGELLLAVYSEGVSRVAAAVDAAVERAAPGDAWARLQQAVTAHAQMMLAVSPDDAPYAGVFVQVQPYDFPHEHHAALIALRNGYEQRFRMLVDALPLRRGVDRRLLRLHLIGALNHIPLWYRADGAKTPAAIARELLRQLRQSTDAHAD
ncbi:MAG: TetR/AcrR family transcriptional regulator [Burkholderiaceae bacterium]|jgi:AcrR family transcriptional regulator